MPIKLKPSTTRRDKVSRKLIMEHTYIKAQSIKVLLDMFNHQTKKSTALTFEDYNFDVNLKRSDFKASRLKRMR